MALFSECMLGCARKALDTADIVRDGDFAPIDVALFVKKGCPILLHHILTRRRANFGDVLWPKSDVIAFSQAKILRGSGIAV